MFGRWAGRYQRLTKRRSLSSLSCAPVHSRRGVMCAGGTSLGTRSGMRLAEFIRHNIEAILAEWEAFASSLLPAASALTSLALRDHAPQILEAVAKDLTSSQTRAEQSEKSKGRAPKVFGASETAAQTHAVLRARGGFDINQLVAEYRALRASVL